MTSKEIDHMVGQYQAGDDTAFQKLWENWFKTYRKMLLVRNHGKLSAESLEESLDDAILRALKNWRQGKGHSFRSFLYLVVHRSLVSRWKSETALRCDRRRDESIEAPISDTDQTLGDVLVSPIASPADQVCMGEEEILYSKQFDEAILKAKSAGSMQEGWSHLAPFDGYWAAGRAKIMHAMGWSKTQVDQCAWRTRQAALKLPKAPRKPRNRGFAETEAARLGISTRTWYRRFYAGKT